MISIGDIFYYVNEDYSRDYYMAVEVKGELVIRDIFDKAITRSFEEVVDDKNYRFIANDVDLRFRLAQYILKTGTHVGF